MKKRIWIGILISMLGGGAGVTHAGTSHLNLDSEVGAGWLSQGVAVEGAFQRTDPREKNLFLRPEEKERLRKRRKGLSPVRWWAGYRLSRPSYLGVGLAGVTEEWSHRFQGGLGVRLVDPLEFAFDLHLQDTPTDFYSSGGIEIFPTWIPAKGWRVELRGGLFGFQKAAGSAFLLSDGSVNTSVEAAARRTQWGLRLRGDFSRGLSGFVGGQLSSFSGEPEALLGSMNAFLELTPAQVLTSSGLSPLRSLLEAFLEYRVEGGIRFGRTESRPWEIEETDPWYLEVRGDYSIPVVAELPEVVRIMPAAGFRLGDRWQLRLEPEIWVSDITVDWLANVGLRIDL